jgi:hypothetical protein
MLKKNTNMYSSVTICMKDPANVVKNKLLQLHPSDSKFVTLDPKTNKLTMCKEISLHQDYLYTSDNKLNPVIQKSLDEAECQVCSIKKKKKSII